MRRRPSGSTAEVAIQIGELWTLREGKVVRGQAFGEREKALQAMGFSDRVVEVQRKGGTDARRSGDGFDF